MRNIIIPIITIVFVFATASKAQESRQAELYRVEKGVFQLRDGHAIDVTDRFLLLTFRLDKKCPKIVLNGRNSCIVGGERFDLKWAQAPFFLGKLFLDKNQCFLDVVKIDAPKGADAIATFRLHCI
jgi:hypothetical protein